MWSTRPATAPAARFGMSNASRCSALAPDGRMGACGNGGTPAAAMTRVSPLKEHRPLKPEPRSNRIRKPAHLPHPSPSPHFIHRDAPLTAAVASIGCIQPSPLPFRGTPHLYRGSTGAGACAALCGYSQIGGVMELVGVGTKVKRTEVKQLVKVWFFETLQENINPTSRAPVAITVRCDPASSSPTRVAPAASQPASLFGRLRVPQTWPSALMCRRTGTRRTCSGPRHHPAATSR